MNHLTLYVLAAGMGSRYGGLKQMDEVGPSGEAIIDYSVFDAIREGFDRVVFVIRRDIEKEFCALFRKRWAGRVEVDFVMQELDMVPDGFRVPESRTKPWGTAHAVLVGAGKVDSPFVVINADDFYGRNAYRMTASWLQENNRDEQDTHFSMVGYSLNKTLTRHGTVARGVCRTNEKGYLTHIEEITDIGWRGDRIGYTGPNGKLRTLTGDEPVSMNIWGFTPAIFPLLEKSFRNFLEKNACNPKAEFYIPTLVQDMIRNGEGDVKVLPNDEHWFGVTYREDKPRVVKEIQALVDSGAYPSNLFA